MCPWFVSLPNYKVGTANSGRAAEGVGVLRSCFVTYESLPNPSLLKGSSINTRQCLHLVDSFSAAELYQPCLSTAIIERQGTADSGVAVGFMKG